MYVYPSPHKHITVKTMLTVTPIDPLHKSDGSNGVKGAAEEDKNRRWGLTGLTGPCPWAKRKLSPSLVWNPWWNKGPIWIGQSIGKCWGNTLKTADSSRWITCPPRFGFLKGEFYKETTWATRKQLGLQGKEAKPHYYKSPKPPHIKVRIIYPSLAL